MGQYHNPHYKLAYYHAHKNDPGKKEGVAARNRKRRLEHKEEERTRHHKYYTEHRRAQIDRAYQNNLKRNFGLTWEDVEGMLARQGGKCAICGEVLTFRAGRENANPGSVDHNHATGKVRGLLCRKCNAALGMLDDNPVKAESLLIYLRKDGVSS
jgi:hypothetical protein